jgi:general secretion pathway protein I
VRGFTLVEVLVALAVLAVALTAALRAGELAAQSSRNLGQRLLADWVAADRLAELRARRAWPEVGISEGMASQAGQLFRWRQTVAPTPNPFFRRIAVTVRPGEDLPSAPHLAEAVAFAWQGAGS